MASVFISYSRTDKEIADQINEMLTSHGIDVWQDVDNIRSGKLWTIEIDYALQDSYALLVICSEAAKKSVNVTYEWANARGLGYVEIIPIYFGDREKEVPAQLLTNESLKYGDSNFWQKLIGDLEQIQLNDSLTNVHIPREAGKYHRELAYRAFYTTYLDDNLDAIRTLAKTDHPIARELLINGLNHPNKAIKGQILVSMREEFFRDSRAIQKLAELLMSDRDFTRRHNVQIILGRMGTDAMATLLHMFKDATEPYQFNAIFSTLLEIKEPSCIDFIEHWLQSGQLKIVEQIFNTMSAFDVGTRSQDDFRRELFQRTLDHIITIIESSEDNPSETTDTLRRTGLNLIAKMKTSEANKYINDRKKAGLPV